MISISDGAENTLPWRHILRLHQKCAGLVWDLITKPSPVSKTMFQVNFSEQSMHELNQLDTRSQMMLVEVVSTLKHEQLENPNEELGRFHRNGKTYYRVRAGDFRIYFEQEGDALFAHYILHKNTLTDFIFRFKLPFTEEFMLEKEDSFWKYLESLRHKNIGEE